MKLILLGGFLGSGKTTAIVGACQQLVKQNKKVAIVTNDQGDQQVDSSWINSLGIAGKEVANGCFCCNYDQLDTHLQFLSSNNQPDYIFAESVGTCTDLIATIARPLNKFHPEIDVVISIFVDGSLLAAIVEGHSVFMEESVRYIFKKQMEEADLLIINKTDLLSQEQLKRVNELIQSEYPGKKILNQNSLASNGNSYWLEQLDQLSKVNRPITLEVDYDLYGEGEAKLAWLDKSIQITDPGNDSLKIAHKIVGAIFDQIQMNRLLIGHLKFFLEAGPHGEKISFTSTSTSADIPVSADKAAKVNLLINARVQAEPAVLEKLVDDVLARAEKLYGCDIVADKWAVFKPGYPRPTHRMAAT